MKKFVFIVLAVIVLGGVGGFFYIKTNLNSIVKSALEKYGSQITQTDVSIRNVDISLSTGEGTVSGFHVGNPKSFIAARAIDIGAVNLQMDTNTVMNDPVVIKVLTIESPQVEYQVNATGEGNLQVLQKNISTASGKNADSSTPTRRVIIKDLYIKNGEVSVSHALLKEEYKTAIPAIHLTNIGSKGVGATPQQVAKQVLGELTRAAQKSGESVLKKELAKHGVDEKAVKEKATDEAKKAIGKLFE